MYASSWFLTLFTTVLPLPVACRIMDVFLSEGMEVIFKVALALLTLGKEDLLCLDMEGMLKVGFKMGRITGHFVSYQKPHKQEILYCSSSRKIFLHVLKLILMGLCCWPTA